MPAPDDGVTDVVVDVPSGRVTARVRTSAGRVESVDFVNVASYVVATGIAVPTAYGEVAVDVAFGGALYAHLDVAQVGLRVEPALRRPDRPRARGQAGPRRPPGRAARARRPAERDLRHDPGRGPGCAADRAAPAQCHDLRRRRGRPLAVRVGHGLPRGRPRRVRRPRARPGADPRLDRGLAVRGARARANDGGRLRGGRPRHHRHRAPDRRARASSSTRATTSPASSCAERCPLGPVGRFRALLADRLVRRGCGRAPTCRSRDGSPLRGEGSPAQRQPSATRARRRRRSPRGGRRGGRARRRRARRPRSGARRAPVRPRRTPRSGRCRRRSGSSR